MEKEKKEISLAKIDKLRFNLYMDCKIKYANLLDDSNFHACIVHLMRQINKSSLKYGFSKKTLAEEVLVLLLTDLGCPEMVARITTDVISETIEQIYLQGYHKKSKCIIS
jgi:hypothetical protein